MALHYEVTADLMTGNALIDSEHKQLFDTINGLMDACAQRKTSRPRTTTPAMPPTSSSTTATSGSWAIPSRPWPLRAPP